eukprot:6186683-Pleurochrysis_carterae.AAC.1
MPSGRRKGPEKRSRTVLEAVKSGDRDRRVDGRYGRFPREDGFVEVDFGSEHDARHAGYVYIIRSRRG